ncbi:MAG TPA: hypothetical protein PLU72_13710 [Candidatus Ozemobacteraceae bacterium]|nr:MAG: hypothetical protein BWY66_01583 [bacterium ADurb.Bin374]HOT29237.1 hypothetical protein [Candidatus Ozemobacteraceae bacterium]
MSLQELLALYRHVSTDCGSCRRIVSRYERTLTLTDADRRHLEHCIMRADV